MRSNNFVYTDADAAADCANDLGRGHSRQQKAHKDTLGGATPHTPPRRRLRQRRSKPNAKISLHAPEAEDDSGGSAAAGVMGADDDMNGGGGRSSADDHRRATEKHAHNHGKGIRKDGGGGGGGGAARRHEPLRCYASDFGSSSVLVPGAYLTVDKAQWGRRQQQRQQQRYAPRPRP